MKLLLNGGFNEPVVIFKGEDIDLKAQFMDDDGGLLDSTGDTWTLEIYAEKTRANLILSAAFVTVVDADLFGLGIVSLDDTDTTLFTPAKNYYAYAKTVAGSVTKFSSNFVPIAAK